MPRSAQDEMVQGATEPESPRQAGTNQVPEPAPASAHEDATAPDPFPGMDRDSVEKMAEALETTHDSDT